MAGCVGATFARVLENSGVERLKDENMNHRRHRLGARFVAAVISLTVALSSLAPASTALAGYKRMARNPYVGAIVVEADSGKVLFEDNADRTSYPASVLKMMTLLLALDRIERGTLKLTDKVTATREAARTGGSQVYLCEKEVMSVDDMLYALMIQSANDAAVALAVHIGGSKPAFVQLMNKRAKEIGMKQTHFASPHGLPPSRGQQPDVTTARDMSLLARVLLKHPTALRYTSAHKHSIRGGKFMMRTHNHLLNTFRGCDGLKTGYTYAGGYSIAATAMRNGVRVVAVVLSSDSVRTRDRKAAELLEIGLRRAPAAVGDASTEKRVGSLEVR
jgi:D-alanyl-D-alanine carboxypeptidase (penicillin-binding protein 5/6)